MFEALKSTTILVMLGLFLVTIMTKIETCSYNKDVLYCRSFSKEIDKCGATR